MRIKNKVSPKYILLKQNLRNSIDILRQKIEDELSQQGFSQNQRFVKSQRYEGLINNNNEPYGIGIYLDYDQYNTDMENSQTFSIYKGQTNLETGSKSGPGIEVSISAILKPQQRTTDFTINDFQIQTIKTYYLSSWEQDSCHGYYFEKIFSNHQIQSYFQGMFSRTEDNRIQFKKGIYQISKYGQIKESYDGEFVNNKFHGKGKLHFIGKHSYQGQFQNGKRHGLGIEKDFKKKTEYIGTFQQGKQNGFGRLIFLNRNNLELRGFWKEGIMKPHEGVYIDSKGNVIELFEQFS